jgi:hypothetical protein
MRNAKIGDLLMLIALIAHLVRDGFVCTRISDSGGELENPLRHRDFSTRGNKRVIQDLLYTIEWSEGG